MPRKRDLVTLLNKKLAPNISLEGYVLVSRLDRPLYNFGGGIATFVRSEMANCATLIEESSAAERSWVILHTDRGPHLIANWYRPPGHETDTIESLRREAEKHMPLAVGTIIVGDMNVHNQNWLHCSSGGATSAGKSWSSSVWIFH